MSWRIWTTNRVLPTVPVFKSLDSIPPVVHTILFAVSLFLILLILFKNNRLLLLSSLGVEVILCLLDINRLQPWEYQYMFTALLFIINRNHPKYIPACIAFLLASTYFYSGLSKLNTGFLQSIWTISILKSFFKVPVHSLHQGWLYYGGYLLGIIELLLGAGLLFQKTQLISAKMLIVMHLFILVFFGSFGFVVAKVLWSWNISMMFLLYYLFLNRSESIRIFEPIFKGYNKLLVLCWGILPILSFFGYWDHYLSSNLYPGNSPGMFICIGDTEACKPLKRFCYSRDIPNTCHGLEKADIQTVTILETGVSAYPEMRVYKLIQEKLEQRYPAARLNFVYIIK